MARYDDEAELFAEDYQAGYVKNLLRLCKKLSKFQTVKSTMTSIWLALCTHLFSPVLSFSQERLIDLLTRMLSSKTRLTQKFADASTHAFSWLNT